MGLQLLIIDDDEEDRELFRDAVESLDSSINCIQAIDGRDALTQLGNASTLPDFIFVDLNMPGVNGIQFLTEIKKCKRFCEIPVIIYTTSKLKRDKDETRRLGAVHFITKPYKLCDLHKEIIFVLDRKWVNVEI